MRSPKSKKMQTLKVDAFQIKFLRKKWEKIIEDENTEILKKGKRTRLGGTCIDQILAKTNFYILTDF
jgi:hypothetical protein